MIDQSELEGRGEHKFCFYCSAIVSEKTGVGDHFPIPKRNGGPVTVPCCRSCHDMKDRFRFDEWPVEWIQKIVQDFPRLNRETKIFLAIAMMMFSDTLNEKEKLMNSLLLEELEAIKQVIREKRLGELTK